MQAYVVCKVNTASAALSDLFHDLVATAQHLPFL